jgi:hypothetical protein
MMKNLILGITLVSLAQTAWIYSAKAEDDNGLRLVTGTVSSIGTSQTPTNTFTIAHPSVGRYVITFTPFVFGKRIPACIVMPLGSLTVTSINEDVSFCDFTIVNLSGFATDADYNFMAARITGNVAPP